MRARPTSVMPAQAGIHGFTARGQSSRLPLVSKSWMPACAGMTVRGRNALVTAFALLTPLAAAAQPVTCPPRIQFTPQVVMTPPAGFTARPMPEFHWLIAANLFDGHPDARVQLQEERRGQTNRWDLDAKRAHTLVCLYEGTDMTLSAPLPVGTRRCEAITKADNSSGVRGHRIVTDRKITEVTCQ